MTVQVNRQDGRVTVNVTPEGPRIKVVREGPQGPQGEVEVVDTVTLPPGSDATVTDSDPNPGRAALTFGIPAGTEVTVGDTTTGAPGSAASVTDGDPSAERVRLDFTIPRGDVGATGPAIGGLLTAKGDLAGRDASAAVRVPVGADGTVPTADSTAAAGLTYRGMSEWEQVATWSALPASGNWSGRRVRVADGLGLCVAVWNGTAWVVAPESDTGYLNIAPKNGWTGVVRLRRIGARVTLETYFLNGTAATATTITGPWSGFASSDTTFVPLFTETGLKSGYVDTTGFWAPIGSQLSNNGAFNTYSFLTFQNWPTSAPA